MPKEYIEREAAIEELKRRDFLPVIVKHAIEAVPAADVVEVRHGRCDVCSGKAVLTQDCYNGYSIEIDAEQQELSIWQGDKCLAYFHIDYCPSCGARMDKEEN